MKLKYRCPLKASIRDSLMKLNYLMPFVHLIVSAIEKRAIW
ncbi:hypothetical protein METH_21355 (plasmid) [Leisingera methylohalidivorans DSM 14336]|uniref:Uncharacterized protein n=1 Tax=Leisingera methylohalidivorans DSM 14336 TaxID=999552 RepID=V9W019_9RHOB|nr:hypothetical protein METH_21355 [Leisingera methylohalidivorans DSM 14336]